MLKILLSAIIKIQKFLQPWWKILLSIYVIFGSFSANSDSQISKISSAILKNITQHLCNFWIIFTGLINVSEFFWFQNFFIFWKLIFSIFDEMLKKHIIGFVLEVWDFKKIINISPDFKVTCSTRGPLIILC